MSDPVGQVLVPIAAALAEPLVELLAEVLAGNGDSPEAKRAYVALTLKAKREALKHARGG